MTMNTTLYSELNTIWRLLHIQGYVTNYSKIRDFIFPSEPTSALYAHIVYNTHHLSRKVPMGTRNGYDDDDDDDDLAKTIKPN